jgi:REP element-mobilizing transposase RayT
MARKPRVYYPGALYHVTLRGNARQAIFFDNRDRTRFYFLLQEGIERFRHRIHAFCLMSNHVHLAIQVADLPLSRIIQNLSFRYTKWINWRQSRSGHLFQGRYKAVLVDADAYLLELTRYIHLNPVRAGMVKEPEDYPWSGHRAYLGREMIPWLTTDWVLSQFSKKESSARKAYERFVEDGKKESYRKEYHAGSGTDSRILGDDEFIDRVLEKEEKKPRRRAGLDRIIREVCKAFSLEEEEFLVSGRDHRLSKARGMAAWLVVEYGISTLGDLSMRTGRDITTLSSAAKRLQIRSKTDPDLAEKMRKLSDAFS